MFTDQEIASFRTLIKTTPNMIVWRDVDGLIFKVIGTHMNYRDGDDVPEPVAVLQRGVVSLLNSSPEDFLECRIISLDM